MDLINKYGLDKGSLVSFGDRMTAITKRIEAEVVGDKSISVRQDPQQPGFYTLTSSFQKEDDTEFLYRIRIDFDKRLVAVACSFLETGGIYTLKTRDHRLMGCRYSLHYNNKYRDRQLKVNPLTGEVIFCHNAILAESLEDL